MEINEQKSESTADTEMGNSEFLDMLRSGVVSKNVKAKKMASQYSLSLIKASMDHIINEDAEEKTPDIEATMEVMREFTSAKKEVSEKYPCSNEMLKELIKDHERIILQLRKSMANYYERYRDGRIGNFINRVIEEHKAVAWTLKRYLVG